jgi:mannose-1-phosphate guanylyltransferase
MGYAAAALSLTDPDEPIVFVPSDHYVRDEERFLNCLSLGERLVRETGKLLDIGIAPTFPSTALGYTKVGKCVRTENGTEVYEFVAHKEKPPYAAAKEYLEDGSHLWHANYYMWTPAKFLEAFDAHAPEFGKTLRELVGALRERNAEAVASLYASLPKTSFDYAVSEHLSPGDMLVIRGDFGWSDIGAWDTLHERLADEPAGNVLKGHCVAIDTTGSLVYGAAGKLTAIVGMDDVIVVDTDDALLVCKKDQAQRVKEIVERLSKEGHGDYL